MKLGKGHFRAIQTCSRDLVADIDGKEHDMNKPLYKSKTFWTGVGGVVTAAAGYATGDLTLAAAAQLAVTSLVGIFLRDAVRSRS
jgi:hypothetical protein